MYHVNDHVYMEIRHMKMGISISISISISIRSEKSRFAVQSQRPRQGLGTKHRDALARLEKSVRALGVFW
jgi:hypothetical protein